MIGRRVSEKGCTCAGRLVWSTITVEESSSRSLRPQISQARRTDPTHPTKGFLFIGGCPEPTLNVPYRRLCGTAPPSSDRLHHGPFETVMLIVDPKGTRAPLVGI